ncbi:hypothetical protein ACFWNK_10590 [Streptomyces sp. NPDC058417]|uniref:hypothetical protein n=1 Tax=unclassified Streptomyces TaxID=2593676 RepID=UPI0036586938
MIQQEIQQVTHRLPATGTSGTPGSTGPGDVTLALAVASALHEPVRRPALPAGTVEDRAPEVSAPQLMGLRTTAARPHRRKVPLNRLTTMRG